MERCFQLLAQKGSAQWVLDGDIVSCFDRISHEWLIAHIPMDTAILRKWLKAGFMDKSVIYPTDEGTPQGGIISPVLANMALDGLERMLTEHFPKQRRLQVYMSRFADDFVITGTTEAVLVNEVRPLVERFLKERGLELSQSKTVVTHIDMGFDFLGQHIRKYKGKLLIKPSRASVHTFMTHVRGVIRQNRTATSGVLIQRLSPLIRGWANYHRHAVSSRTFSSVDHAIWQALWQWARRRHPTKGTLWVKGRYFPAHGSRQWVFTGTVSSTHGDKESVRLPLAAETPIRRHVSIRGAANPFDPLWTDYLHRRNRPRSRVLPRPITGAFDRLELGAEEIRTPSS
jgi:RNA-directed DNA polymerase